MLNVLVLVLGSFFILTGVQTCRVVGLEEKVETLQERNATLVEAAKLNKVAMDQCLATNQANEREAQRQREQSEQAAVVARMLRAQLEQRITEVTDGAEELEVVGECPAADDPAFGDWLYRDT